MDLKSLKSHLNYEVLANFFFDLAEERYPSSEKIKQMTASLVDPMTRDSWENVNIKIAVLSAMRNMVKAVSPNQLYRSLQHRDDLFLAIIEALEDFEDDLEEIEDKLSQEQEEEEAET